MREMSQLRPSASFSATLRVHVDDRPGAFAELARAIGDAGGSLGAIDLVRVESAALRAEHGCLIAAALEVPVHANVTVLEHAPARAAVAVR